MTNPGIELLRALQGKSLVTAESCTGGGIGAAITAIPGSSKVYKGGIISYANWVKEHVLGVDPQVLELQGPVSRPVAAAMAEGARRVLEADAAISVTGLAGPDGDEFGHPVGTVFIGCSTWKGTAVKEYHFSGSRDAVRQQAVTAALEQMLEIVRQR